MYDIFSNISLNKVITVLSAYSIVQVLAQDLDIKTGVKQKELVNFLPIQIILLHTGAYTITNDHQLAAITVGLYYFLKHIYSGGVTE